MLRQINFCHLVRMSCIQGFIVEVRLSVMTMIRRDGIMIIGMHMQSHALDKHQGDSQVKYPKNLSYQ